MPMLKGLATVLLTVALVGSPLSVLFCDDTGPAAMACCQGRMTECNRPGSTADCCKMGPIEKEAPSGPTQLAAAKPNWTFAVSLEAGLPVTPAAAALPGARALRLRPCSRTAWADLAPPLPSILRL